MNAPRPATAQDADAIAAIWNKMIREQLATFTTIEKTETEIRALIAQRDDAFWVVGDDVVQGFATYGPFRAGPGYGATAEHTIILSEAAIVKGLGRALLAHLMAAAAAQGIHVLVAGISSANPNAVAFHTAMGFTQTARMPQVGRKRGQWLDLILMQKVLSAP